MRKLISFMHLSLDGFVAGPNGEMNWIKIDEELFTHVGKRISKGDTAVYGRNTFGMMESYWPTAGSKPNASRHDIEHSRWYNNVQKIVLSRTLDAGARTDIDVIRDNLAERISALKQQPGEEILVFGSPTATHALMREDLIDGYWLFVNPVILGRGIPLFHAIPDQINLNLVTTRTFTSGVTELSYVTTNR